MESLKVSQVMITDAWLFEVVPVEVYRTAISPTTAYEATWTWWR
jgi:hypothetical protein